jgi:hypothetical protein
MYQHISGSFTGVQISLFTTTSRTVIEPATFVKEVKLSLCLTKHYAMKTYGGVGVQIHAFLTSALVRGVLEVMFIQ